MRPFARLKRTTRSTALAAVIVAALVAGLATLTIPSAARAQTPAAAPIVSAGPAFAVEKSAILAASARAAASTRVVSIRRAEAAAQAAQAAKVQALRTRIVTVAKRQIGDRYSAGATGPSAFDCSGLTRYVYKVATGKELPHQSHAQYAKVKRIKRSQAQPGDLVFFFRGGAHHVGIFIGDGRMVDAAGYGEGVRISPISGSWWGRTYTGMGRLLPA